MNVSPAPERTTGSAAVDEALGRLIAAVAAALGGRLRAVYALGSAASGQRVGGSDVDVLVVTRNRPGPDGEAALRRATDSLAPGFPARLDVRLIGEPSLRRGVSPGMKEALRLWGRPVLEQARLEPLAATLHRSTLWAFHKMFLLRGEAAGLAAPLDFPAPGAELLGYDGPGGGGSPRPLVNAVCAIAAALLARHAGRQVESKTAVLAAWRQSMNGEWLDVVEGACQVCRDQWQYRPPQTPEERQWFRGLAARTLAFENHFLAQARAPLLDDAQHGRGRRRRFALDCLWRIGWDDEEVFAVLRRLRGRGAAKARDALRRMEDARWVRRRRARALAARPAAPPAPREPLLTVGVPCGRGLADAARLVRALDPPARPGRVRVLLARWAPRPFSPAQLEALGCRFPVEVALSQGRHSPSMCNAIVRHAAEGHVLFLDDDVLPGPGLLDRALELIAERPDCVYQGPAFLASNMGNWVARMESLSYERFFRRHLSDDVFLWLDARLMLAPRRVLARTPFDERLTQGGKGRALAEALWREGVALEYAPELIAYHRNREDLAGLAEQKFRQGIGRGRFLLAHGFPGGFRRYARRYFKAHFKNVVREALACRLPWTECAFDLCSAASFWAGAAVEAFFPSDGRPRRERGAS